MGLNQRQEDYWVSRIRGFINERKTRVLIDAGRPKYLDERIEEGVALAVEKMGIANEVHDLETLDAEIELAEERAKALRNSRDEVVELIGDSFPERFKPFAGYGPRSSSNWENQLKDYGKFLSTTELPDDEITVQLNECEDLMQIYMDGIMAATTPKRLSDWLTPRMAEDFGVSIN